MDAPEARRRIAKFFRTRSAAVEKLVRREPQLLELLAMTAVVTHYETAGFDVRPANLKAGRFRVKLATKARPENFSHFVAHKDDTSIEIHSNVAIRGSSTVDQGQYVVDVGVIRSGSLPRGVARGVVAAAPNDALFTFAEVKKLVIYPMLLAQFTGIVHELMPTHIHETRPDGYDGDPHFMPALLADGYLTANARDIVNGYPRRGYWLTIVPDIHARVVSSDAAIVSPLLPPQDPDQE